MSNFCISCGTPMVLGAKFCGACGGGLGVAVATIVEKSEDRTPPSTSALPYQNFEQRLKAANTNAVGRRSWLLPSIVATGVIALFGWIFVTPYLAVRNLQQAALSGDVEALKEGVDFPALRSSLKEELGVQIAKKTVVDAKADDAAFAAIGSALAGGILNVMIDQFVSPQVIAGMVQGKRMNAAPDGLERIVDHFTAKTAGVDVQVTSGYESLNRFSVRMFPPKSKVAITLVFIRSGLVTWRLSGIRLPDLDQLPDEKQSEPSEGNTLPVSTLPIQAKTPDIQVYVAPDAESVFRATGLTEAAMKEAVGKSLAAHRIGSIGDNAVLEGEPDWVSVRFSTGVSSILPDSPLSIEISVRNGFSANNQLIRWQQTNAIKTTDRPNEVLAAIESMLNNLGADFNSTEYKTGRMNDPTP